MISKLIIIIFFFIGQTIIEPTSDTNENIITTNSSLPPSKKDETDQSISTSTISPEKTDETTTTTTVYDNKNTLDSNIVNNNTIIKVEETNFKKEKSTTPVSVNENAPESAPPTVDKKTGDDASKVIDQINANTETVVSPPQPVVPAPLHASKTAPSSLLQHQSQHRKSEEAIKLDKPIKSAASRSLEKPRLAIEYHVDQWSPANPEGKRKYTVDQLMVLAKTEVAKEKPTLPSNLQNVLTPSTGKPRQDMRNFTFLPDFMKPGNVGSYNKRPSQQGNRGQGQGQGNKSGSRNQDVKRISLKMNDVQLKEVENAWKPKMLQGEDNRSKDEKETDELTRKFRSTLNKLTPENFDTLVKQIMSAKIDTTERLKICIELVFEKAISEPNYSTVYAKICKRLSTINIPHEQLPNSTNNKPVTFKVLLLNQCQSEFEKHKDDTSGQSIKNEEIEKETDEAKRKQLKEQQEEDSFKIRRRAVGTVKFIGELYKIDMLVPKIMFSCIQLLLDNGDEDSLECLCKLLTTIGQRMEANDKCLENYFKKLNEISDKKAKNPVSSRIR